jgi:hypothetical protein
MGLLDFIFGSSKTKKGSKLFVTSREIEKVLFHLETLDQKQRNLVKNILIKYMGSGGVSVEEFKRKVLPELYQLMQRGEISSVDYQKLKSLISK